MTSATKTPVRTLSTADQRREEVLRVAMKVVGERGLYGTPTMDVARAAGISQAYLFRLFPTKTELFLAVLERSFERIEATFREAIARSHVDERPLQKVIGEAYGDLLVEDRALLLVQLQGQAAAGEPEVRQALRHGFKTLYEMFERDAAGEMSAEEMQAFFAHGMLCNVIAALELESIDAPWAQVLSHGGDDCE